MDRKSKTPKPVETLVTDYYSSAQLLPMLPSEWNNLMVLEAAANRRIFRRLSFQEEFMMEPDGMDYFITSMQGMNFK